jgi:general secretion pathway protein B
LVTDPEQAHQLISDEIGRETGAAATRTEAVGQPPATAPVTDDPSSNSAERSSEDAKTEDWAPERVEFIEVWDLPLPVRQELPDLDLSIHVFSGEPADRFVLINGERRLEGASLGGGVRVAEIVRQGAIVEFRDYRFLIRP